MNAQYEKLLDDMYKAWSDHDVEKVVGYYTDDCVYEDMAMGVVNRGKEALRQFIRDSYKALPDFRVVYTQRFASDSRAAGQWVITGTWNGLFEGVDCTGTKIRFTGLSLYEFRDGLIASVKDCWDFTVVMKALGVLRSDLKSLR
jgi:steroid delta-isomerase-like uncharacterized protein